MAEREKIQKAFIQCSDALMSLDQKSILKVFHLLSVHFDIVSATATSQNPDAQKENASLINYLPASDDNENDFNETKKVDKKTFKKARGTSSVNLTYLTDFDFMPSNTQSLNEFYGKHKTASNQELNLLFIYYLQEILKVNAISTNHVFSCYRHLGLPIPSFPQTLNDTKRLKGWIETANSSDLSVTRVGINHIEHKMTKNDGE